MNHLETLKAYQAWRRDDTEEPRTLSEMGLSAMAIGHALDWAIAELDGRPSETEALTEIRAEAARKAIMHTLDRLFGDGDMLVSDMVIVADEYAAAIRQEADL